MILLCGIPSESPLAMVAEALDVLGAHYRIINQRQVADCAFAWQIDAGLVDGTLRLGPETLRLQNVSAMYIRLMDDRLLPELCDEPDGSPARRHCRAFH